MSDWHAPNQQSVGVDPSSGGGVAPPPDGGEGPANPASYDPSAYTAAEVIAYANAHPDEVDAIYDAELAGKNRSTVLTALG